MVVEIKWCWGRGAEGGDGRGLTNIPKILRHCSPRLQREIFLFLGSIHSRWECQRWNKNNYKGNIRWFQCYEIENPYGCDRREEEGCLRALQLRHYCQRGPDNSVSQRAGLCPVGREQCFWPLPGNMPGAYPICDNQKCLQILLKIPRNIWDSLVENS